MFAEMPTLLVAEVASAVEAGLLRSPRSFSWGTTMVGAADVCSSLEDRSLAARFNEAFAALFERLLVAYERAVRASLVRPWMVIGGVTAVFLVSNAGFGPTALLRNLEHNHVYHERMVMLNMEITRTPPILAISVISSSVIPSAK